MRADICHTSVRSGSHPAVHCTTTLSTRGVVTMNLSMGAVVVDDHPRRREIVCSILAASGVPVLAAAASGHAAAEALVTHRPRVVFISFEEPYQRAASAVDFVTRSSPDAALIAYSSSDALNVFQLALRAGARTVMPAPFRASDVQQVLAAFVPASTQAPAPRTHGRIVAIVGNTGRQPNALMLPGSAANAACLAVIKGLADAVAGDGITVNALNPGPTRTARWDRLIADMAAKAARPAGEIEVEQLSRQPLGRIADARSMAQLAVVLASDLADWVTGTSITADGGATGGLA